MKINFKNLGWAISTALDRLFYLIVILDFVKIRNGEIENIFGTCLYQHTGMFAIIMLGWVWSIVRNGMQPFASTYVRDYLDDLERSRRKKKVGNIVWIDNRRSNDDNDHRLAK